MGRREVRKGFGTFILVNLVLLYAKTSTAGPFGDLANSQSKRCL